jgi:hypothetical protein
MTKDERHLELSKLGVTEAGKWELLKLAKQYTNTPEGTILPFGANLMGIILDHKYPNG